MELIDVRTLMLCFFLTAFVGTLVIFLLWRQNSSRFKGTFYWVLDYGFLTIGLSLITIRGAVPDWVSIIISNTLLITGTFLGYVGTARLLDKKPKIAANVILILIFAAVMFYSSVIQDSLRIRTMIIGIVSMIIFAENALLLLVNVPAEKARLTRFTGFLLAFYSLINFTRFIHALVSHPGSNDFMRTNTMDKLALMISLILLITLTFSLALMFNGFLNLVLENKRKKLTELNATKDKLFSIIAHDLKSPFNSIMGFTEILKEDIAKKDDSESMRYAGIIQDSSKRAMELLQNLLEWSQSQTGRIEVKPVGLNIHKLVNEIIILKKETAALKRISLENQIPEDAMVYADHDLTAAIFRNLLSNAIKFSYPDKEVLLSARIGQNTWEVSVTDHGTGIEPEALDKLFRIDQNYSKPGTANEKGTGLGLLLCNEFAEKQGCTISVISKPGEGSTFSIKLPIWNQPIKSGNAS
jgi:signal transduction histidine kinase